MTTTDPTTLALTGQLPFILRLPQSGDKGLLSLLRLLCTAAEGAATGSARPRADSP